MIVYISDKLNSKKNGGVSLSGVDFLQLLRMRYGDVSVITSDGLNLSVVKQKEFLGKELGRVTSVCKVRSDYRFRWTVRSLARKIINFFTNLRSKKKINLKNFYTPNGPNLIFVNSWSSLFQSGRVINDRRFRRVCIVRGNPESFMWQNDSASSEDALKNATNYLEEFHHLIFVSNIGKHRWEKLLERPTANFYLPNSIDEAEVSKALKIGKTEMARKMGFEDHVVNLVAVGSVQRRKGQDMLLSVAKELEAKGYSSFIIHVVGVVSEMWGGSEIVRSINSSDFSSRFKFHGHRDDALSFVAAADICLFPSRAEAFPRTVAEYMALGKAIVSTDASGVPEMLVDNVNGLLCAIDDSSMMARKIIQLIEDPTHTFDLESKALITYNEKFSKTSQSKRALEIFSALDEPIK